MKKINLLFICIIFTLYNCAKKNQKATISAHITNMKSDTVKVGLTPFGENIPNDFKTIILKNETFSLDTLITEPQEVFVVPNEMYKKLSNGELYPIPSKIIRFFIYPKNQILIKGEMKDFKIDCEVSGNILNEQYTKYIKKTHNDTELICKLMYVVENLYSQNAPDSIINISKNKRLKALKIDNQNPINYISKNTDIEISSYLLYNQQKETIKKHYNKFDEKVKNSDYGKLINKKINTWNEVVINSDAPDFEYETYKNGKFKLSENKKKYLVLDFWGSWCGPCMMDMPKMKEFHKENKDKVKIVGIAARDEKEKWIKAINENELNWTHILNDKKIDDLVKKYGVMGFPTKIIISPNGKIKGIYLGIKDDFFIKMNELLAE